MESRETPKRTFVNLNCHRWSLQMIPASSGWFPVNYIVISASFRRFRLSSGNPDKDFLIRLGAVSLSAQG